MRASRGITVVLIASLGAVCWSSAVLAADPRFTAANMDVSVKRGTCPDATIQVVVMTDNYGSETTWEVTEQGSGTVMGSGGPYDPNTLYTVDVCVSSTGCYDFTIYDGYGDGICCSYGNGYYEVYLDTVLVGSGAEFTTSETVSSIGGGCGAPPTGACCDGETCTGTTEEAACAFNWHFGEDCGTFTCPSVAGLTCPGGSLYSQDAHGSTDSWSLGTSEVNVDGSNYLRAESFSGVVGDICDVHWWGAELVLSGSWVSCTDSDPTYNITFYNDAGGQPGTVVQSFTVQAAVSPTNELFAGSYPLNYYSVDALPSCVSMTDGWVSVQGVGDTSCWFLWDSSPTGDGTSCLSTDGGAYDCTYAYDNAVCLTGQYTPSFGACCDDNTGVCQDNVEIVNCTGRFTENTLCADLAPPCGGTTGACCTGGACSVGTEADCFAGGGTFQGAGSTCTPDPCACTPLLVRILTDNYGSETTWEVTEDGTGTVIASGGPYDNTTLYEVETCVDPTSCYTFTIYDSASDGICCGYGDGYYEVYYDGTLVGSGGDFGASESVGFIGGGCVVPTGACCDGVTCTGTTEQGACAFDWYGGEDCASFTCPSVAGLSCPGDSLYSQGAHGGTDSWSLGTSEVNVDGTNYLRSESFSGVTSPICDVHWWGAELVLAGSWTACTDSDPTYNITFYADAGGQPGAVVQSYTVQATVSPTNEVFAGAYPLNYYSVDPLPSCVTLTDGWVSVQGVGDVDCWFLWDSSPTGDGTSCLSTDGGAQDCTYAYDNAVCLTGQYVSQFGACCDDTAGTCQDNVEIINCTGRFAADTLCADLSPPCGLLPAACCNSLTGVCAGDLSGPDCAALADHTWHEGESCATFTCPAPPLVNDDCFDAIPIGEVVNLPFDTTAASNDGGGTCLTSPNIWYDYTASCYGEVHASLCGSAYDTKMAVYDGVSCNPLDPQIDCNDDSACAARALQSEVWFNVTAGNHYMIEVGGYSSAAGPGVLSITCPPQTGACCVNQVCTDNVAIQDCAGSMFAGEVCANVTCPAGNDVCPAAIAVNPGDTVAGSTIGANNSGAPTCDTTNNTSADVWYSVIGNGNRLTASTCNSAWDTKLTVYTDGCTTLTCVGGNDDAACARGRAAESLSSLQIPNPVKTPSTMVPTDLRYKDLYPVKPLDGVKRDPQALQSEVEWCSEPGREYLILVHGYGSEEGDFTLDIIDGTSCSGACCVQEVGSCACTETVDVQCAGTFMGEGTTCADTPDACNCNNNAWCDVEELEPGNAIVFEATGIGMPIPDGDPVGIDHVINVSSSDTIQDLNVDLDVSHTYVSDLCVSLTHPSGSPTVNLILRMGDGADDCHVDAPYGCGADDFNILLDDEGPGGAIEDQCAAALSSPPSYTPQEALSAFDGLSASGDWTLTVIDNAGADTGTLNAWSLHFNAGAAPGVDCNNNGTPDDCEEDCNGNGIPDDCDITDGTSTDCDGNGVPDECDLAGGGVDCNGNGTHDACDIADCVADPACDDCDGNGIPDGCDIANCAGGDLSCADCQPDGIPDGCQLNVLPRNANYQTDDGSTENSIGLTDGGEPAWLNYYVAQVGGEQIVTISTAFGTPAFVGSSGVAAGDPVRVYIWDDPTNDGDPTDAVLLWDGAGVADAASIDTDVAQDFAVGGSGVTVTDGFWIGASVVHSGGFYPMPLDDSSTPANGLWTSFDAVPFDPNNLGPGAFELCGGAGLCGNWLLRATGVPSGPPVNDCNGNGIPDDCDTPVCGNGCLEGNEECDDGGESATCDADCTFVVCGDGTVNGTAGETCDATPGDTSDCCDDSCVFEVVDTVCRVGSGDSCDSDEVCTGSSADCPADSFDDGSGVCRMGTGDLCDPDEYCPGTAGGACPADVFEPGTTVCRAAVGECGVPESCPGFAGGACPSDSHKPEGTECGTDATECKLHDTCSATGVCVTAPFFACGPTDGCCPPVGGANGACGPRDHDLDCGDPVPTVSAWGLMVLALLLMVAGKVYFGRRRVIA